MFKVFLNDPLDFTGFCCNIQFFISNVINLSILLQFFFFGQLGYGFGNFVYFSREATLCLTDFMDCSLSPHVINFCSDLYYFLLFTALGFGFSCLFLRSSDLSFGHVSTVTLVFLM